MRQIRITMPAAAVFAAAALLLTFGGPVSEVSLGPRTASAASDEAASEKGSPYVSTHLYFGTGRHNGNPPITEEEFMKFVAEVVTPRFPSGLTLQEARGQWRDKEGDVNRERSYELTLMYPVREAHARNADIEYIRRLYCTTWELESVGRADVRAQVDF
ncbi:DUF3574 domain-containing protein [Streptomyces sp. NBC_00249]|uniref:DUF3574 domain-containing protein n=1 Tax=Streptomyces sp. NBC_00249 TaxID=2975690 RepID=UPI00225AFE5E|nr:DUF3574 domain-containing protein [Streptomyces sp. NBC_00249]MCX5193499.1 DUF3574 domain-containing protein [Streptomyces sp. NBC_00249]